MNGVKELKSESTELPDCVISHIFSLLTLKNLVKTSALSKQWYHQWGLKKNLNFDLHNLLDYNTIPELPITLPLFQHLQSQFAASLDSFMQTYPGDTIRSIRVDFPLGADHTYAIDGLIHKAVLKGASRIHLLFAYKTDIKIEPCKPNLKGKPYTFLFPFFSCPNSLTYLHLQRCHIAPTMKFSGLKNLRTLVLTLLSVGQNVLQDLCFSCIHLKNFTLNECNFLSDLKITSPTLLHLNIYYERIRRTRSRNIDIIALNLLSFKYSSGGYKQMRSIISLEAPKLLKVSWEAGFNKINLYNFATIAKLHHPENLTMPMSLPQVENLPMHMSLSQISELMKEYLARSGKLRQLELYIAGAYNPNMDYFWILDIAMASQHLQKLSLTVSYSTQRQSP
ncbi:hypothetical protein KIW84_032170 [Lathyrus oleraceus]|uniref:Uncharacterized protein n=1 Tax=Pisum sativum TaxID=3888 RepID=A0A9D4XWU2_PEA|nr:hypothetical protein KIW84_032170 [Pisum sativum]